VVALVGLSDYPLSAALQRRCWWPRSPDRRGERRREVTDPGAAERGAAIIAEAITNPIPRR
jgi:hypothetical protein